jgi:hypothetical protein
LQKSLPCGTFTPARQRPRIGQYRELELNLPTDHPTKGIMSWLRPDEEKAEEEDDEDVVTRADLASEVVPLTS